MSEKKISITITGGTEEDARNAAAVLKRVLEIDLVCNVDVEGADKETDFSTLGRGDTSRVHPYAVTITTQPDEK